MLLWCYSEYISTPGRLKISLASVGIEPAISNVASPCEIQKVQKIVRQSLRYLQQNFTTLQNLYDAVSNCADEIS
jgi:hypothetical protein